MGDTDSSSGRLVLHLHRSEVFQRAMEELFAGCPCAIVVDDLLVWGEGTVEHDVNLRKVLQDGVKSIKKNDKRQNLLKIRNK